MGWQNNVFHIVNAALLLIPLDIYYDPGCTKTYYASLNSQKKDLCQLVSYMNIGKEETK